MIRPLLHRGKRIDNDEVICGFYWYITKHYDARLSNRHFIKDIHKGVDFEVEHTTIQAQSGYLDINLLDIYEGDTMAYISDITDDTGEPVITEGIIEFDPDTNEFWFSAPDDVLPMMELIDTYGGYLL